MKTSTHFIDEKKEFSSDQIKKLDLNFLIIFIMTIQLVGETFFIEKLMRLKPIPIILMILESIYLLQTDKHISIALSLSLIGDILLMVDSMTFFYLGTLSFLFGHIFYISSFLRRSNGFNTQFNYQKHFVALMIVGILCFFTINNYVLWDILPNKILFSLYGIVLSCMTLSSLLRFKQKQKSIYFYGVIGAVLFMISDTIIGHTRLRGVCSPFQGGLIMLCYYIGQFFILKGNSKQKVLTVK